FTKGGQIAGLKDPEVNASLLAALGQQMSISSDVEVSVRAVGVGAVIDEGSRSVVVDWVLAAIDRQPTIEGLVLDTLGVELDERGMPAFNPKTLQVGDLPVYIAGDVNGQRPLLHEAADEGRIAAYHALHPEAD